MSGLPPELDPAWEGYDPHRTRSSEAKHFYEKTYDGLVVAEQRLIRFWIGGNAGGIALTLSAIASQSNGGTVPGDYMSLLLIFGVGLLCAWLGMKNDVVNRQKQVKDWDNWLKNPPGSGSSPLAFTQPSFKGRTYAFYTTSGLCILFGAVWGGFLAHEATDGDFISKIGKMIVEPDKAGVKWISDTLAKLSH